MYFIEIICPASGYTLIRTADMPPDGLEYRKDPISYGVRLSPTAEYAPIAVTIILAPLNGLFLKIVNRLIQHNLPYVIPVQDSFTGLKCYGEKPILTKEAAVQYLYSRERKWRNGNELQIQ